MTSTAERPPSPGDADGGTDPWGAVPLASGALGADPVAARHLDAGGLSDELPPLPLTGPLADALASTRAGLDAAQVSACCTAPLGPEQRLQALRAVAAARQVADAVLLRLTSTFTRDDLRVVGATDTVDLLIRHTGASPQRARTESVLAAALTAPPAPLPHSDDADVPFDLDDADAEVDPATGVAGPAAGSSAVALARLGAAHAGGRVSTDVAALAARIVASLPAKVRRATMGLADEALAGVLPTLDTYQEAREACEQIAQRLDPDRCDRGFDPDDVERRYCNTTAHDDGWVDVRARLDPVNGAQLIASLDHLAKPDPDVRAPLADHDEHVHDDGGSGSGLGGGQGGGQASVPVRDTRTATQRRADGLGVLARQGVSSTETRGGEPPRVIVTTTADQLAGTPGAGQAYCETTKRFMTRAQLLLVASSGVLQAVRMSCDGPDAAVLSLGRAVRLFTASQRRAMLARDGGCVIPGCTAPPGWLEAHHVHDWSDGGPTDVDSGVLLCSRHHLLVTLGVWQVRMVAGVPQVLPPRSVDPLRRWVLNPRRALRDRVARAAEQLLLDPPGGWRDDPPGPGPGSGPGPRSGPSPTATPDIPSPRGTCEC